jgi:hypothetical protein
MMNIFKFLFLVIIINVSFIPSLSADDKNITLTPKITHNSDLSTKLQNLRSILNSLSQARKDLLIKQEQLSSVSGRGREDEITANIKSLASEIKKLEEDFAAIAGDVDPQILEVNQENEEIKWGKELQELLAPLLDEVKRLSSRPRENARLRTKIEEYGTQLSNIEEALSAINELQAQNPEGDLAKELTATTKWWEEEQTKITANLKIAQTKLKQNEKERQSFFKSIRTISELFFKSRGKNLILAILFAFIFWFIIRHLYFYFHNKSIKLGKEKSFYHRVFNVAYLFLNGIGTAFVFFTTLFFFEDWVLLTLGLLVGLGVIWTSKEALPKFWDQAVLLLNLGGIRENERVIYNGIPFKVQTINFFSVFVNPVLDGGRLRVPLKDLANLRSRVMRSDEIWFPTRKNDWVLLNDDTFGQVLSQSTEVVVIMLKGGARKSYLTNDFVATRPTVLSDGFRIESTFGIDYKHQAEGTNIIPDTLKKDLIKKIAEHGFGESLKRLVVEFALADSSSLNLIVLADFDGKVAGEYPVLKRLVQKIAVESATENGWNIPFPQLSLHVDKMPNIEGLT